MGASVNPDRDESGYIKVHDSKYEYTGLDARLEGTDLFTAPKNATTVFTKDFTFDCKFNGLEMYAFESSPGDKVKIQSEYYVPPLSQWFRYKKFGKEFNIYPKTLQKYVLFPTEPIIGVRLSFTYKNVSLTDDAVFSLNLFQFINSEIVNTDLGQQGIDW